MFIKIILLDGKILIFHNCDFFEISTEKNTITFTSDIDDEPSEQTFPIFSIKRLVIV